MLTHHSILHLGVLQLLCEGLQVLLLVIQHQLHQVKVLLQLRLEALQAGDLLLQGLHLDTQLLQPLLPVVQDVGALRQLARNLVGGRIEMNVLFSTLHYINFLNTLELCVSISFHRLLSNHIVVCHLISSLNLTFLYRRMLILTDDSGMNKESQHTSSYGRNYNYLN